MSEQLLQPVGLRQQGPVDTGSPHDSVLFVADRDTLPPQPEVSPSKPLIAALGGGHGLGMVVAASVFYVPNAEVVGLVSTFDNGGSTGRLRRVYNTPAVGDLTVNLLSTSPDVAAAQRVLDTQRFAPGDGIAELEHEAYQELFEFGHGEHDWAYDIVRSSIDLARDMQRRGQVLAKHSFRNILLTSLALEYDGDLTKATEQAGRFWNAQARIVPLTHTPADLVMDADGRTHYGEDDIDRQDITDAENARVYLDTEVPLSEAAANAVRSSLLIVQSPGTYTSSVLASLAPQAMRHAIARSPGAYTVIPSLAKHKGSGKMQAIGWGNNLAARVGRQQFDHIILDDGTAPVQNPLASPDDLKAAQHDSRAHVDSIVELRPDHKPVSPHDEVAMNGLRGTAFHSPERVGTMLRQIVRHEIRTRSRNGRSYR